MYLIDFIRYYLPWIMSCITIYQVLMAGNKSRHAWLIGLLNQGFWLSWILVTESWGLLPMNIALWIVYTRNHFKWNKPKRWVFQDNERDPGTVSKGSDFKIKRYNDK